MYPLNKYKYIVNRDKKMVVAVSSYCGRSVYGRAFCAENDQFDAEIGKLLAAARCDHKICQKRAYRAFDKYKKALEAQKKANEFVQKMSEYYSQSCAEYEDAKNRLESIENALNE